MESANRKLIVRSDLAGQKCYRLGPIRGRHIRHDANRRDNSGKVKQLFGSARHASGDHWSHSAVIAVERGVMALHRSDAWGHLVSQRELGLVVALPSLQRQGPRLQVVERSILSLPNLGRPQDGACAVNQQQA